MSTDPMIHAAACHCRTVRFTVRLVDGFDSIRRCSCSFCRMRGAIAVSTDLDGLEFIDGEECLSLYHFNTMAARHWFCSICGIYTHHRRRSNPEQYGVNVACLDGVSPFDFAEVTVVDGIAHPTDTGGKARTSGVLRYVRS